MTGRPKAEGFKRRVQLRIDKEWLGVFDSYSPDELSSLMNQAIASLSPSISDSPKIKTVIRPAKPASKTIARISSQNGILRVLYSEKCEDFREAIKLKCKFEWSNPFWVKKVKPEDLDYEASYAAYSLLSSGYCVQSEMMGISERVVSGSFAIAGLRKIARAVGGDYDGFLSISWPGAGDNYYDEAIAITAAKYSSGSIYVPSEHYEEILDFAERYDFSITQAGQELIEVMKHSASVGFIPSKKRRQRFIADAYANVSIPAGLIDED
jgi:hypothetical protein